MTHLGDDNMPAGLHADWNDCLRLGKKGESTFVAMQLYYAMTILRKYAEYKNDAEYIEYLDKTQKELGDTINAKCWEDDRYVRGIKEDDTLDGQIHSHADRVRGNDDLILSAGKEFSLFMPDIIGECTINDAAFSSFFLLFCFQGFLEFHSEF